MKNKMLINFDNKSYYYIIENISIFKQFEL